MRNVAPMTPGLQRIDTQLPGVSFFEPRVANDARGFFLETYHERALADLGLTLSFVQDNHSRSVRGTLRGLHYQLPHAQGKLCRVARGEVLDVAVDIRRGSSTFGKSVTILLSDVNLRILWIPPGFAHGFVVLSEVADFLYKCSDYYAPDDEHGVLWNDRALGIDWGIDDPLLSDKDRRYPRLSDVPASILPVYAP